jgi:hypothetical protein
MKESPPKRTIHKRASSLRYTGINKDKNVEPVPGKCTENRGDVGVQKATHIERGNTKRRVRKNRSREDRRR